MTKPIDCTTSTTPSSSEEIDQKLAEALKHYKSHVMVIDLREQGTFKAMQMDWDQFFCAMGLLKQLLKTFIIIKQDIGPLVVWNEKGKVDDAS